MRLFLWKTSIVLFAIAAFAQSCTKSFWIDELLTYWIINDGFDDVFQRSLNFQVQSPFYFLLLWFVRKLFGNAEWILRLPSLLAILTTCFYISRICNTRAPQSTGIFSAFLFVALCFAPLSPFWDLMTARPYGLAVMFATMSIFYAFDLFRTTTWWSILRYAGCTAFTIYAHYLFAPIVLLHVLMFLFIAKEPISVLRRYLLRVCPIMLIFLIPAYIQMMLVMGKVDLYILSEMPKFLYLVFAWNPGVLPMSWFVFPLACRLLHGASTKSENPQFVELFLIGLTWWLLPALALFAISHLTNVPVFLPRYFLWTLPGIAISMGILFTQWCSPKWIQAFSILLIGTILLNHKPLNFGYNEDWRAAVKHIDTQNSSHNTVVVYPYLVESLNLDWALDSKNAAYLLAPLSYYSLPYQNVPVSPNHEHFKKLFGATHSSKNGFWLLARNVSIRHDNIRISSVDLFTHWANEIGYSRATLNCFGTICSGYFIPFESTNFSAFHKNG